MRFVSRSANYMLIARPDAEFEVFETNDGVMIPRSIKKPPLVLEFKHGMARPDENYAALMHWQGSPTSRTDPERVNSVGVPVSGVFGAIPYQRGVSIQDGAGRIMGVSNANRPDFSFSLYDTEWLDDPKDKSDAETALLDNSDFNLWYVKVDAVEVPAPWPNYSKVKAKSGGTVAGEIARRCSEDGYDANHVIEYEKAHANRTTVLDALNALLAEQKVSADEVEALTVQVV